MRQGRINPPNQINVFHCFSRAVAGQHLFHQREKEQFRRLMWKHAAFCHMQIITYAVMINHFHIVTRSPRRVDLTNPQLLAKLKAFYGPKSNQVIEFASAMRGQKTRLAALRQTYLARMGNVSVLMKELKQAFSRWYNRVHERFGTLWAERFGSKVIEDQSLSLLVICLYVDLNALRAGLVKDPKDYRFCGYAEALARHGLARQGLVSILPPGGTWKELLAQYRKYLFLRSGGAGHSKKKELSREEILKALKKGAKLSIPELLRVKVRYFTAGVALGNREFVDEIWRKYRSRHCPKRKTGARKMKGGDWAGMMTMRDLKKDVIG